MKGIKGVSARLLNLRRGGRGKVWQADYFDRIIRGERELYNTLNYMLSNPVKHGLAEDPMEYPGWYLAPDAGGEAT